MNEEPGKKNDKSTTGKNETWNRCHDIQRRPGSMRKARPLVIRTNDQACQAQISITYENKQTQNNQYDYDGKEMIKLLSHL